VEFDSHVIFIFLSYASKREASQHPSYYFRSMAMGLSGKTQSILLCSAAALSLAWTIPAGAQERLERGATRLDRIVKGTGEEKVAVDTPQAVTVVEQDDLDEAQPTTIGDTFRQVPGATTSGSERVLGESINIRGVGAGESQADEGRIILSVDGAEKNYQQYRLGGFFSEPELYKRIEILRGPGSSTLYGSGALAGTVLFTTKDASDFLEDGETAAIRLKSSYESNAEGFFGSAIAAWRPNENAELLIAGNYRRGDDYKTGNGSIIDADFLSLSGLVKGTFYFGENNEQSLRASYQKWYTDAENQQYAQTVNSAGFGRVDRTVTDETYILAYENPASGNDWVDFKAQVSYSETLNQERNATTFFFGPGPGIQFFPDADFSYATWQAKAQNTFKSEGQNWENYFTIGGQYIHMDRSLARRNTGAQPEGTDEKIAFFAQNEFIYDDRLTIIPGVRIDYREMTPDQSVVAGFAGGAQSTDDFAFSPKLAVLYKFNETFSVFGSYAHTERFPTLDEVYDYRTGAVPGLGLKKERSDNFEIGFGISQYDVFTDGDAFQIKTTAFNNDIKDYIFRSPVASSRGPGPGSAFVNIGDVRLYGVEVEAVYSSNNWYASAGLSIIRGEDSNNSISSSGKLNTVPPDELFANLGYRLPDYGVSFGWSSRFVASQNEVFGTPVGRLSRSRRPSAGFATHGIFLNWVPPEGRFKGLEVRASIENLFDKQYKEFLANDPGKGRTFKVSVVKKFGL